MQTRKKRCHETKCTKYSENVADISHKFFYNNTIDLPKILEKSDKAMMNPTLTANLTPDEIKKAKNNYKTLKKLYNVSVKYVKNETKNRNKIFNSTMKSCIKLYCNAECKETEFESGTGLPKSILNKWAKNVKWLDYLKAERIRRFGKKTNVLIDDFYEELDSKMVDKAKKDGAISGCFESF